MEGPNHRSNYAINYGPPHLKTNEEFMETNAFHGRLCVKTIRTSGLLYLNASNYNNDVCFHLKT